MEGRHRPGWLIWLIIAAVPLLYVLSSGPARSCLVTTHHSTTTETMPDGTSRSGINFWMTTHPVWDWIYGPLDSLADTSPGELLQAYWNCFPSRKQHHEPRSKAMHGRRRPGWVFWLIFFAIAPVLYILSSGPARSVLVKRTTSKALTTMPDGTTRLLSESSITSHPAWDWVYGPLEILAKTAPGEFLQAYWRHFPSRK